MKDPPNDHPAISSTFLRVSACSNEPLAVELLNALPTTKAREAARVVVESPGIVEDGVAAELFHDDDVTKLREHIED